MCEEAEAEAEVEELLEIQSIVSSEDPPIDQWSSLILVPKKINQKVVDYQKGLYKPGSGEICTKYFPQSDSDVPLHPFFRYPPLGDPGIEEALFNKFPVKIYPPDGVELYVATCKETMQSEVAFFKKNLLNSTIDLSYHGINPDGVCPMAVALEKNTLVHTLNLTENFLNFDACFHLGELLKNNTTLKELNLESCRIGPYGLLRILEGLKKNTTLKTLNLKGNELGDSGIAYMRKTLNHGFVISELYLGNNDIRNEGALTLADILILNNKLSLLDLSYNNFAAVRGICNVLDILQNNTELQTLDLSWNALITGKRISVSLANVMSAKNLAYLYLSHNRLSTSVIVNIAEVLPSAKKLVTLDLSYNPLKVEDAITLLTPLLRIAVKVKNLLMDNVNVNTEFMELLQKVKNKKFRRNTVITHGSVIPVHTIEGPDLRDVVMKRLEFLCIESKVNIRVMIERLVTEYEGRIMIDPKSLKEKLKHYVVIENSFVESMGLAFPGPQVKKDTYINMKLLLEYTRANWELPPKPKKKKGGRRRKKKAEEN